MQARLVTIAAGCLALLACRPEDPEGDTSDDESSSGDESSEADESSSSSEGTTDTAESSSDTAEVCPTPLPPAAFEPDNQLAFGLWLGGLELPAGSAQPFQVGLIQCCVFWEPLETCSEYAVEPEGLGATMDPETGLLTLADEVPDGTLLTIRADIEDGLALVEDEVFVYHPELHPLKGFWQEVARIPCGGGPEFVPSDPINELFFTASGTIGVTWNPFEIYIDYTGDYVADLDAGTLSLSELGGNYVPDDVDPEGSFELVGDELVLTDMWLGSSQDSVEPAACGHRFAK